ncbi:hypothetical protein DERF_010026 [Dermatophagoides farinae]|uniref:Uncharacterized protein n=1 Tax=Dermatophagoides farinae TaxID=6954 RepID=A0A922HWB2_DERFA|nr:hypothetical protein DERF_010026 [Dermatophagoides farinae]
MTSRISSQPLNDNTSNRANIPLPSESKLKRRGLALCYLRVFMREEAVYFRCCSHNFRETSKI